MRALFSTASLLCSFAFFEDRVFSSSSRRRISFSNKSKQISEYFSKRYQQNFSSSDRTSYPKTLNKWKTTLSSIASLLYLISKHSSTMIRKRKFEPHTDQIMHVHWEILRNTKWHNHKSHTSLLNEGYLGRLGVAFAALETKQYVLAP